MRLFLSPPSHSKSENFLKPREWKERGPHEKEERGPRENDLRHVWPNINSQKRREVLRIEFGSFGDVFVFDGMAQLTVAIRILSTTR